MKARALLLIACCSVAAAETSWLWLEDAGETQVPAAFIFEAVEGIPYFLTEEGAQLSANWVQYAQHPGAARSLQARETQEARGVSAKLKRVTASWGSIVRAGQSKCRSRRGD